MNWKPEQKVKIEKFMGQLYDRINYRLGYDEATYSLNHIDKMVVDFKSTHEYSNYYFMFRLSLGYGKYKLECCTQKKLELGQAERLNSVWLILNGLEFENCALRVDDQLSVMLDVIRRDLYNKEDIHNGIE